MRKLDIGMAWRDTRAMLRGHGEVLWLLAGLFLLVPSLLAGLFMPDAPERLANMTQEAYTAEVAKWISQAAPYVLPQMIVGMFGSLAIWQLLLARTATVGDALSAALRQFLPYFVAAWLMGIGVMLGWMLLIVPGIYLYLRLALIGPHMAASGSSSPIEGLRGSWRATKGNVFWLLMLMVLMGVITIIAIMILGGLGGALFSAVLGADGARIPGQVLNGVLAMVATLVITVLMAAIYRQLGDAQAPR